MALYYYIFCVIYSAFLMIYFLANKKRYESSLYVALFLIITIANIGNLYIAMSKTVEEAVLATKVASLGGQIIPPIMLLILSRFVKFKYHNILLCITTALSLSFICLTTFGIAYTDLYYKSVNIVFADGVAHLEKEYGPLHLFATAYQITYILGMIAFLIFSFTKTKQISYKNALILVLTVVITSVVQFFSKAINPSYDLIALAYCFSGTLICILTRRTFLYNINAAASINLENKEVYGCMGFDKHLNYLGCNSSAAQIFPEIAELQIDMPLPENGKFDNIIKILTHMKDHEVSHDFYVKRDEKFFKITIQKNMYRKRFHGYFVEITDDTENLKYMNLLQDYNKKLEADVKAQTEKNSEMQRTILVNLADMISTRDESTGGHVKRTSYLISILAKELMKNDVYNKDEAFYDIVKRAAPMHDLGKLSISEEILNKPGRFTPEEFEIMKGHSAMGGRYIEAICKGVEDDQFLKIAKNVARHHHEKFGGGGYPDNLSGENIPVEARIMALADVYDALVSKRVYKERMSFEKADSIIQESFGIQFDPALKPAYEACRVEWETYYKEIDE